MIVQGDALKLPLADESVDLIVTSPPYFALRSYRDDGEHYEGQVGSEPTPEAFLEALDKAMVEMGRVLKGSGSVFINLGDKYAGTGGANSNTGLGLEDTGDDTHDSRASIRNNTKMTRGFRPKTLLGLPWRFAIRQIDNGWILRAELIWSKPNGLPESVTDRVRRSHEQWFHFTKKPKYFSAVDEIREPYRTPQAEDGTFLDMFGLSKNRPGSEHFNTKREDESELSRSSGLRPGVATKGSPLGRLPGSVWTIPTEPLQVPEQFVDHFAAFPQEFPRKLILGWSPSGICTECGEGRRPTTTVIDGDTVQRRQLTHAEAKKWTAEFRKQCQAWDVSRQDISTATQTSDMYSRWTTAGQQPEVPNPTQWEQIKPLFDGGVTWPMWFEEMIYRLADVPLRRRKPKAVGGDMEQYSFRSDFNPTTETIAGYACACPNTDAPTRPSVILDPFGGTGTVAGVARKLGRIGISLDLSMDYSKLAQWRVYESGHFDKTLKRTMSDRQGTLL